MPKVYSPYFHLRREWTVSRVSYESLLLTFNLFCYITPWIDSRLIQQEKMCPSVHISLEMWNQKSVCLSLSLFLAVGEGCYCSGKWESLYKYSQGFHLPSQPPINSRCSAKQLRESNKPESRLTGEGLSQTHCGVGKWVRDSGWVGEKPGNCHSQTWGHKWGWDLSERSDLVGRGVVKTYHIRSSFQQLLWLLHVMLDDCFPL